MIRVGIGITIGIAIGDAIETANPGVDSDSETDAYSEPSLFTETKSELMFIERWERRVRGERTKIGGKNCVKKPACNCSGDFPGRRLNCLAALPRDFFPR